MKDFKENDENQFKHIKSTKDLGNDEVHSMITQVLKMKMQLMAV